MLAPSAPARDAPITGIWLTSALVALVYVGGHLLWYRETPLGHGPVLDEQENLAFAESIVRGVLPHEPFYRAAGYPLLLAVLRAGGVSTSGIFSAALALGAVLHAFNAALVARIACRWFGRGSGWAAGLLFALNPVLVHYSTQALDAVPALTFFLLGLACIAPEFGGTDPTAHGKSWRWAAASVALASATLCRPNYLAVWCALPLLAAWASWRGRRVRCVASSFAGVVLFVALAGWQYRVSGIAGFLPWQGTYNLWAANAPGAHGRYYVQRTVLPPALAQQNAARSESIYFFRVENGRAPVDFRDLNAYWRRRFIERITQHPFDWMTQLGRKTYALLNDWEQYNNKTYAFHQARSPWLRWNPLGWGVLFVMGIAGYSRLLGEVPRAAKALTMIVSVTALSVVLFFVSARFRLPLAGVLTVLAGGAVGHPQFWRIGSRRRQWLLAGALGAAAALTFSRFDGVRDRTTFVADHGLIARAAFSIGDYATAWREANDTLALQAEHRDAQRVAVSAYFNQLIELQAERADEPRWLQACKALLATPETDINELRAIAVLGLWRTGARTDALLEWQKLGGTASAVAARLLVGDRSVAPADLARAPAELWSEPLVQLAAAHFQISAPVGVALPSRDAADAVLPRLFAADR